MSTRLLTATEVAARLGLATRLGEDVLTAGLAGEMFSSTLARALVCEDAVIKLAERQPVQPPHSAALVLRVTAAKPETRPEAGRMHRGWSEDAHDRLDGVRGWYQMADEAAARVVDERMPVVVTLRGFVVTTFTAAAFTRSRLGVRFQLDAAPAPAAEAAQAAFRSRRLTTPRGGPIVWLPGSP